MDKKQRKILFLALGGVIVLLLILGLIFWLERPSHKQPPSVGGEVSTTTIESTVATSTTSTVKLPAKKSTTSKTTTEKPLTYEEAVKMYENNRFQFSNSCSRVTPTSFVLKKGSRFMIDNREDKFHIFSFLDQKYSVKPYSFVIVTAQTVGVQPVLCDGAQRATVNIQK
ncbi:MAG TPA: hypothetical protein PKY08_02960 [Candidatus Magasanikbacteria bacterium]|nr:hypothetical protein [Candidatus Magasanikbacteria bacterium]